MSVDRPLIKLLHTSDVHIGDDYDPARRMLGLTGVVEAALDNKADAVLIVGDLFDSARVKDAEIQAALEQLARLTVPTIITAGNHDCLDEGSIYNRVSFPDAGDHVHFLDDPDGQHLVLDELRLAVWARGLVDHHPGHKPVEGYAPHKEPHWQVVLAHGHYVAPEETSERSSLINGLEIGELGCNYLALGHWHRFLDVSHNGVAAFYPGSPSEAGGTFPSANLVTLDQANGVSVKRIPLE